MQSRFCPILIVILGALIVAACSSKDGNPTAKKAVQFVPSTVSADGIPRITIAELESLIKSDDVVVIDVRNQDAFDEEHIPGAKLIPETEIVNRTKELPSDKLIVTYCS